METGRRGLCFQTRQGTEYYYDDFTGLMFPAPPAFKETLFSFDPEKLEKTSPYDLTFGEIFIQDHYKSSSAAIILKQAGGMKGPDYFFQRKILTLNSPNPTNN